MLPTTAYHNYLTGFFTFKFQHVRSSVVRMTSADFYLFNVCPSWDVGGAYPVSLLLDLYSCIMSKSSVWDSDLTLPYPYLFFSKPLLDLRTLWRWFAPEHQSFVPRQVVLFRVPKRTQLKHLMPPANFQIVCLKPVYRKTSLQQSCNISFTSTVAQKEVHSPISVFLLRLLGFLCVSESRLRPPMYACNRHGELMGPQRTWETELNKDNRMVKRAYMIFFVFIGGYWQLRSTCRTPLSVPLIGLSQDCIYKLHANCPGGLLNVDVRPRPNANRVL